MASPISFEKTLRETIIETLPIQYKNLVGSVSEDPDLREIGWWFYIGEKVAFFGRDFKEALVTAKIGDWFIPSRDGPLSDSFIDWLSLRANLDDWKTRESREERRGRVQRVAANFNRPTDYRDTQDMSKQIMSTLTTDQAKLVSNNIIEFLKVFIPKDSELSELPGLWVLDSDNEILSRVVLTVYNDGYSIKVKERINSKTGMKFETHAVLEIDSDQEMLSLTMTHEGEMRPYFVLGKVNNNISLKKLLLE